MKTTKTICAKPSCTCEIEHQGGTMESRYCSVACERGRPCGHEGCDCVDTHENPELV